MLLRLFLCLGLLSSFLPAKAQEDTAQPWFPGGDDGFYQYLSERLLALGHDKPAIRNINGDLVTFEFTVTDSGYLGDVKVYQCNNINLCYQVRLILNSIGKVNPIYENGKAISTNRIYNMAVKRVVDGYQCMPATTINTAHYGNTNKNFRWALALVAVIAMFIVVFN